MPSKKTKTEPYCLADRTVSPEGAAKFGYWECDLRTGEYQGTGFARQLFDLTRQTSPSIEDILPFVHPEDREKAKKFHRLLFEGQGSITEFHVVMRDKIHFIQTASEIILNTQGKPIRAVGFIQDMTKRRQEEQAHKKSEQQYHTLFHDVCYAIWIMSPDGSFVQCNQKTLDIYKANSEKQLREHTFASLAPQEPHEGLTPQQKAKERIQVALEKGHAEFEWLAEDLDGRVFWTNISLTKLSIPGEECLQVILRDINQEKKSKQQLAESQEKYKSFFENTFYPIAILSEDLTYVDGNIPAPSIFGLEDKDDLLGKTPLDFSPEYQPDGMKSIDKASQIKEKVCRENCCDFDWVHKKIDGTEFWTHISLTRILVGGEHFFQVVMQDIDEAKRARQLLKESEEKYRSLFENSYFAIFLLSSDGHVVDCNFRTPELFHVDSKEAFLNTTPDEVSPVCQPDGILSSEKVKEKIKTVLEEGACDFDWYHKRFDGTEFWVHVCLTKIAIRGEDFIQVVIQDIDEAKRAKELIQESELKYRNLFENSFFAICLYTPDGHLVDCNSRMPELFRVDDKERFFNTTPMDISPPYQPDSGLTEEKAKEYIQTALKEGASEFDWYLRRFDGTEFWSHICLTKVCIGGEDLLQVILQDTDEARRTQQQLKENELRQKFILRNSGLNIWAWDVAEGMVTFIDQSAPIALTDFAEKIPISKVVERCHPDDIEKLQEGLDELSSGKSDLIVLECQLKSPDDEWLWIKTNAMIMERDQSGNPLLVMGCNRNIDKEKRAQEMLKESEAKYRNLFENSFFAIGIRTPDAHLIDCNARMPELFHVDGKESLLGTTPLDLSPPYQPDGQPSSEKAKEYIDTALTKGVHDFDWYHRRFDGTEFWTHVCLTKVCIDGEDFLQVIIQDIDEAKRAKQLIQESESKYRNLFENSFFAICLYTPDGHLVDCNSRMPELFHAENKEMLLDTMPLDISPPYQPNGGLTKKKAREYIKMALKNGASEFDWYLKRFDDTEFWAHVCLTKVCIDGKNFVQAIIQDIDEAKRMQQQLKENELRQKFIIKNTGLSIWVWDTRTKKFSFMGESVLRALTDLGHREFGLEEFIDRYHPDDVENTMKLWGDVIEGKLPAAKAEYRLRTPEGEWRWLITNVMTIEYDQEGKPLIILGCNQDIDEAKRAQEMLKESEQRKEFIIENAGLNLWILDLATGNAAFESQNCPLAKHFPEDGINVLKMIEKVHPEDREAFAEQVQGLLDETIAYPDLEYRYPDPKGGWTWIKTSGMITERNEDGTPKTAVGFHQDVTDRKLYEQELLNAQKITEEANHAKSLFLANMSHEIRTPMTAILGYLDLIYDPNIASAERNEYIEIMRRNGMHLLELINEILDLSKIESGQVDVKPQHTKTSQLIDCVIGPLESLAGEKRISLQVDYLTEIPQKIWTDPRLLRQVLWNIIGNAVKFTEKGQVVIEVEYCVSPEQQETKQETEEVLKIRVKDTGCGIPPERLATIFEPFVQADATVTRKFGGTGLGLAIARRHVEMLDGTIQAWNNKESGATFEVVLPLSHTENIPFCQPERSLAQKPQKRKEKAISEVRLKGVRILLAEDGLDNQRLISTVLQKAGATVDIAGNGQEAIEMIQAVPPEEKEYDAILMDMQMPVLDGYSATSKLREMNVNTPIIALTAHAMADDRKKCIKSGCDGYCTKPIRPRELIQLISRYVRHQIV